MQKYNDKKMKISIWMKLNWESYEKDALNCI